MPQSSAAIHVLPLVRLWGMCFAYTDPLQTMTSLCEKKTVLACSFSGSDGSSLMLGPLFAHVPSFSIWCRRRCEASEGTCDDLHCSPCFMNSCSHPIKWSGQDNIWIYNWIRWLFGCFFICNKPYSTNSWGTNSLTLWLLTVCPLKIIPSRNFPPNLCLVFPRLFRMSKNWMMKNNSCQGGTACGAPNVPRPWHSLDRSNFYGWYTLIYIVYMTYTF